MKDPGTPQDSRQATRPSSATAIAPDQGIQRRGQALLGFAALALVMAYRYQPIFLFFPVQAFHLGLIFFAAGHLAEPAKSGELLRRLAHDARSWLGLCYAANLVAGVLTLLLIYLHLDPGGPSPDSIFDFFLGPFGCAEPYALFQPAWILIGIFFASAVFLVLAQVGNRLVIGATMLVSTGIAIVLCKGTAANTGLSLLAGRTAFAVAFYLGGALVKTANEQTQQRLLSPTAAVLLFLIADVLGVNFSGLAYRLGQGSLGSHSAAALLGTAAIVLLLYSLANQAARIVGERSFLLALGRSWHAVLVGMSAAFFATNAIFLLLGFIDREQLPVSSSFAINKTWLFYLIPALALPALLFRFFAKRREARAVPA